MKFELSKVKGRRSKVVFLLAIFVLSCTTQNQTNQVLNAVNSPVKPTIVADKFAYPISKKEYVTEAKDDKDDWYNATNFGEDNHLGEDWNKNSGGNTDCGEPVYAIGNGTIVYADHAGTGWGNVVIIEHTLPDGKKVESLYGHLQEILKKTGEVKKREQIGKVGNADGKYLCHLHLEIREQSCPLWRQVGPGYAAERDGWVDPSEFIDKFQNKER
jgi:murein DD-endopeptidase MepM/ murein hydrolase activator NlpD